MKDVELPAVPLVVHVPVPPDLREPKLLSPYHHDPKTIHASTLNTKPQTPYPKP